MLSLCDPYLLPPPPNAISRDKAHQADVKIAAAKATAGNADARAMEVAAMEQELAGREGDIQRRVRGGGW